MRLGYADKAIRVQTVKKLPHKLGLGGKFPALSIKVAYAERYSHQEKMLREGKAINAVSLDISFHEKILNYQVLEIADGESLRAYSLTDLIAEKYRALLQQVIRNRYRRQDVYDLHALIPKLESDDNMKTIILSTFIRKCKSREFEPYQFSVDNKELEFRSRAEWNSMKLEIGELPDFDSCYGCIMTFYRQLPWHALD